MFTISHFVSMLFIVRLTEKYGIIRIWCYLFIVMLRCQNLHLMYVSQVVAIALELRGSPIAWRTVVAWVLWIRLDIQIGSWLSPFQWSVVVRNFKMFYIIGSGCVFSISRLAEKIWVIWIRLDCWIGCQKIAFILCDTPHCSVWQNHIVNVE